MMLYHVELFAKFSSGGQHAKDKRKQQALWEDLTAQVNAVGNSLRTVPQIKEKWRNLVKTAKTDYTAERVSARATGGGPCLPAMSQTSQDISGLMQASASFSGIPGAGDAETVISDMKGTGAAEDLMPQLLTVDNTNALLDFMDGTADALLITQEATEEDTNDGPLLLKLNDVPNQKRTSEKRQPKNLKELQMTYYEKAIAVQDAQLHFFERMSVLTDVITKKL